MHDAAFSVLTDAYVRHRASLRHDTAYSRQKHFVRFSLMLPFKSCPVLTSIFVSMRYMQLLDATRATRSRFLSLSSNPPFSLASLN